MSTILIALAIYLLIGAIIYLNILFCLTKGIDMNRKDIMKLFFLTVFGWLYLLIDFYIKKKS
jgi:hypothetical protein